MPRTIVTPGELITSERKKLGSNVHMHEGRIYSTCIGLVEEGTDFINVIPLEGRYRPMIDDLVVGIVTSERFGGYGTDINSYYPAYISRKEVDESLRPGSIISAKIAKVNEISGADERKGILRRGNNFCQPCESPKDNGQEQQHA